MEGDSGLYCCPKAARTGPGDEGALIPDRYSSIATAVEAIKCVCLQLPVQARRCPMTCFRCATFQGTLTLDTLVPENSDVVDLACSGNTSACAGEARTAISSATARALGKHRRNPARRKLQKRPVKTVA